jgi:hypothetical protein
MGFDPGAVCYIAATTRMSNRGGSGLMVRGTRLAALAASLITAGSFMFAAQGAGAVVYSPRCGTSTGSVNCAGDWLWITSQQGA